MFTSSVTLTDRVIFLVWKYSTRPNWRKRLCFLNSASLSCASCASCGSFAIMQIGKNSPKLVELRRAIRYGTLTSAGLLPIEGPILLDEAQRSGIEIVDVFVRADAEVPAYRARTVYEVS